MEFAELIQISRVDNVRLRRPGEAVCEVTVAVTGHHLIISRVETEVGQEREVWLLHRNINSVTREKEGEGGRSGSLIVRYKDLRTFNLDIIGPDKLSLLASSLEQLASVRDPASSYPFFYNPGFRALEDGWEMFRPEEELVSLLQTDPDWRVSRANSTFSVCPSYGRLVAVPSSITDDQMLACARVRVGGRLPVLVTRYGEGVCLLRASRVASQGRRCQDDERLLSAVLGQRKRGFLLDLVTGGKAADLDTSYPRWKKVVQKLPGLSDLRESLTSISVACNDTGSDKWLARLASTRWLSHVKEVLNTACLAAQCLQREEAPVLVVEDSGRDLSLVVCCLATIILQPDTRTLHGFEALLEREWVQSGHPFWSRHGPALLPSQELQGPVFLLFLDCVHQIHTQFPCSFEFTAELLVVLADHSLASNFGTFLCDSELERSELRVREHTVSLWSYLNQVEILVRHLNCLYLPNKHPIWPSVAPMSLNLWTSYFLRWVQGQAVAARSQERRKMVEICDRNKEAQVVAYKLRRELKELIDEAVSMGLLKENEPQREEGAASSSDLLS